MAAARGTERLIVWKDTMGRDHEIPALVKHLLQSPYRGQDFSRGTAAKKILLFFHEEPVFLLKNELAETAVPGARWARGSSRCRRWSTCV